MGRYTVHTEYTRICTVCKGGGEEYGVMGGEGTSDRYSPAAKYLYWSVFKKSRHLGFGVFIDSWSMVQMPRQNNTCALQTFVWVQAKQNETELYES